MGDKSVERAERLLDRCDRIVAVDLIQVDVISLKAAKTRFHPIHDVPAGRAHIVASGTDTPVHLCRENNVLAGNV